MSEKINILDQEELDYLNSSEYKIDYPGLSEAMDVPRFTISDLGVTARDATYWSKKEILPKIKGGNTTRRKYTLKQACGCTNCACGYVDRVTLEKEKDKGFNRKYPYFAD